MTSVRISSLSNLTVWRRSFSDGKSCPDKSINIWSKLFDFKDCVNLPSFACT